MKTQQNGFTLVELMVALAILGIVAVFALPMFGDVVERNRVVAKSNEILGAFTYARTEAVKSGSAVSVGGTGSDWAKGVTVTAADGTTLRVVTLPSGYTLSATTTTISVAYDSTGFASSTLTLQLCPSDKSIPGRQYSLALSGLVTVTEYTCP